MILANRNKKTITRRGLGDSWGSSPRLWPLVHVHAHHCYFDIAQERHLSRLSSIPSNKTICLPTYWECRLCARTVEAHRSGCTPPGLHGDHVQHAAARVKLMLYAWGTSPPVAQHHWRMHNHRVRWDVPSFATVLGKHTL